MRSSLFGDRSEVVAFAVVRRNTASFPRCGVASKFAHPGFATHYSAEVTVAMTNPHGNTELCRSKR